MDLFFIYRCAQLHHFRVSSFVQMSGLNWSFCGTSLSTPHSESCQWRLFRDNVSGVRICRRPTSMLQGEAPGADLLWREEVAMRCLALRCQAVLAFPPTLGIIQMQNGAWRGAGEERSYAQGQGNIRGGQLPPPLSLGSPLAGSISDENEPDWCLLRKIEEWQWTEDFGYTGGPGPTICVSRI